MIRRMGFVGGVLLSLVFVMPAFESHACADEPAPASVSFAVQPSSESETQCPDCGPACAGGCCHAQHSAVPAEPDATRAIAVFIPPLAWADAAGRALGRPAGPDRPPRN